MLGEATVQETDFYSQRRGLSWRRCRVRVISQPDLVLSLEVNRRRLSYHSIDISLRRGGLENFLIGLLHSANSLFFFELGSLHFTS